MNKESNKLNQFKGQNPFKLPEGYMENLSSQIMDNIPERIDEPEEEISLRIKIRPFLYMAGMFTAMGFFLKLLVGNFPTESNSMQNDSLLVNTEIESVDFYATNKEDKEYLEYVEEQYSAYLLKEEVVLDE